MADVKWIKLSTDIFDSRKIKQIEKLPEGDTIIVIWLKLLTLAGKVNDNGQVYFTPEIPYTEQMLATEFNRPLEIVQMAIRVFQQFNMVDVIDEIIMLPSWAEYQNIEGLDKVREQGRIRQQRYRERHKELPSPQKKEPNKKEDLFADVPSELQDAFKEWAKMRKKIGKPITTKATVTRNLNALYKLSKRTDKQIAIINQSIDNCWAGFWELKKQDEKPKAYKEFEQEKPIEAVEMPSDVRAKLEAGGYGNMFDLPKGM